MKNKECLVIGSGKDEYALHPFSKEKLFEGYSQVSMDFYAKADIHHDANVLPWPVKADSFDGFLASHVMEHLKPDKLLEIFSEINRVCKDGARIVIYVPHFQDDVAMYPLTHYKLFGRASLDVICDNIAVSEKYITGKFDMASTEMRFGNAKSKVFPLVWLSKKKPIFFERFVGKHFPPFELRFELINKKKRK
jgi:SAM-dependent methyltransferase